MKKPAWRILGVSITVLSFLVYLASNYAILQGAYNVYVYLARDIAVLPILFFVGKAIIDRVINERDKRSVRKKLNMVIGAFFSEMGTKLLGILSEGDLQSDRISDDLVMSEAWSEREFLDISKRLKDYDYTIDSRKADLVRLKTFLAAKNDFLLRLLENPSLLEQENFTNLLLAVFHFAEELAYREDVSQLSDADHDHLSRDMKRAYVLLISEWLMYMKYLKHNYPHLFSLAMRRNPFDRKASVEFR